MKNSILLLLLPLSIVLFSCKETIDPISDFKETAVVYGLLDQNDSIHYVKITRAFLGPGNALEIAQNPDSNYFNAVDAQVTEFVNGVATGRSWTLRDTVITNKNENGVFYAPDQRVYVFYSKGLDNSSNPTQTALLENASYRLSASINNGLFSINGETSLVTGISTNTDASTYSFKFIDNTGAYKSTTVSVNVGNSYVVNASMDVHYTDFIGTAETPRKLTINLGETECEPGNSRQFVANGATFYQAIAAHCAANGEPLVDKRNFVGLTIRVVGGHDELYKYMLVNQPSSSLAQNKPTYTNLTATNGHPVIGIFSARYTKEVYHEFTTPSSQFLRCLDKPSTEFLCISQVTGPYLFCSQHPQDLLPSPQSWACD